MSAPRLLLVIHILLGALGIIEQTNYTFIAQGNRWQLRVVFVDEWEVVENGFVHLGLLFLEFIEANIAPFIRNLLQLFACGLNHLQNGGHGECNVCLICLRRNSDLQ